MPDDVVHRVLAAARRRRVAPDRERAKARHRVAARGQPLRGGVELPAAGPRPDAPGDRPRPAGATGVSAAGERGRHHLGDGRRRGRGARGARSRPCRARGPLHGGHGLPAPGPASPRAARAPGSGRSPSSAPAADSACRCRAGAGSRRAVSRVAGAGVGIWRPGRPALPTGDTGYLASRLGFGRRPRPAEVAATLRMLRAIEPEVFTRARRRGARLRGEGGVRRLEVPVVVAVGTSDHLTPPLFAPAAGRRASSTPACTSTTAPATCSCTSGARRSTTCSRRCRQRWRAAEAHGCEEHLDGPGVPGVGKGEHRLAPAGQAGSGGSRPASGPSPARAKSK